MGRPYHPAGNLQLGQTLQAPIDVPPQCDRTRFSRMRFFSQKPQQDLLVRLDHMPREFGLMGRVRAGPRLAEGVADRDINMSNGVNTEMD